MKQETKDRIRRLESRSFARQQAYLAATDGLNSIVSAGDDILQAYSAEDGSLDYTWVAVSYLRQLAVQTIETQKALFFRERLNESS